MWGLCGLMGAKKAQTVQRLCVGSVGCWLALTCLCDDMLVVYCGRVSKIYNLQVQYVLFWAKQGQTYHETKKKLLRIVSSSFISLLLLKILGALWDHQNPL